MKASMIFGFLFPVLLFQANLFAHSPLCGLRHDTSSVALQDAFITGAFSDFHSITYEERYGVMGQFLPTGGDADPYADFGITESVPRDYLPRYRRWKADLLATEYGRELWARYENNRTFSLKIVVTGERRSGAGTDDYKWNDSGELVGATIYLGKDLDKGFPDPIYYPVMNSLSTAGSQSNIGASVLASAKFAHEIGHVNHTSQLNGKIFQQQNKLIAGYYKIFLKNGHNASDPRLIELVEQLGARPIEIWEDREYWSEVSAMRFLVQRLNKDTAYCSVFRKIKSNLSNYAVNYRERFADLENPEAFSLCGL